MIQPYLVFKDRIHKAINSRVWRMLGTKSTNDLEEEQDLSVRAEGVRCVDTL